MAVAQVGAYPKSDSCARSSLRENGLSARPAPYSPDKSCSYKGTATTGLLNIGLIKNATRLNVGGYDLHDDEASVEMRADG